MRFSLYFSVAKAHGQRRKVDGTRKDKSVDGKTKTQKRRRKAEGKKIILAVFEKRNDASLEKEEEEEESQEEKKCVFVGSAE